MKKVLILLLTLVSTISFGQHVTKSKTISSSNMGQAKLRVISSEQEDIELFTIYLRTGNQYYTKIIDLPLGSTKQEALELLQYLLDLKLTKDDIVTLPNSNRTLCGWMMGGYMIFSEGRQFTASLTKGQIRKFIKALQEY